MGRQKSLVLAILTLYVTIAICEDIDKSKQAISSEQIPMDLNKANLEKTTPLRIPPLISPMSQESRRILENIEYTSSGIPKLVWTYWDSQRKPNDHFHNIFVANRKHMLKGWQIVILNRTTVVQWLNQIPNYGDLLDREQIKTDFKSKQADAVRLALIKHYGGVWVDYTTILVENFDWIENIHEQELIDYRFGDSPDLFMMYNSKHSQKKKEIDPETGRQFLLFPSLEVFFIFAKPQCQFMKQFYDFFMQGKRISYQLYKNSEKKSYFIDIMKQQEIKTGGFKIMYFQTSIAAEIVLQRKQKQFDERYEKGLDKVRKFAIKQYKIWTMGTATSAYFFDQFYSSISLISAIAQTDIEQLKKNNHFPRYYLKLYSVTSQRLQQFLITQKSEMLKLHCPLNYFILDRSILYKYMLQFYNQRFYLNHLTNLAYPHHCISHKQEIEMREATREYQKLKVKMTLCYILFLLGVIGILIGLKHNLKKLVEFSKLFLLKYKSSSLQLKDSEEQQSKNTARDYLSY